MDTTSLLDLVIDLFLNTVSVRKTVPNWTLTELILVYDIFYSYVFCYPNKPVHYYNFCDQVFEFVSLTGLRPYPDGEGNIVFLFSFFSLSLRQVTYLNYPLLTPSIDY